MAKEEQENESEDQEEAKPAKSGNMKIIIIAVLAAVLLSGGLVGATLYFFTDMMGDEKSATEKEGEEVAEDEEEEEEIPLEPPQYHSMDPKFVVSFRDQRSARFMQFSLEVMARNKMIIDQARDHSPAVRSNLLMLFDNQSYDVMSTREGKQQLLKDVVLDINNTLQQVTGEEESVDAFEAAYFTSFVIQ